MGAKICVNEGARHMDACRVEKRFSGVYSIKNFRLTLLIVILSSIFRICVLGLVSCCHAASSGAFETVVAQSWLWSQISVGLTLLGIGLLLVIATQPPVHVCLTQSSNQSDLAAD